MNLSQTQEGQRYRITSIIGADTSYRHLANLGIYEGTSLTLISHLGKSLIISIQGNRYGLDHALASLIEVSHD